VKKLNTYNTRNLYGGGMNLGIAALIGAGISFVIGVFDGQTRPK
jgi:hypothetical protein